MKLDEIHVEQEIENKKNKSLLQFNKSHVLVDVLRSHEYNLSFFMAVLALVKTTL